LVTCGFYATLTAAKTAIQSRKVFLNGQIASDSFVQLKAGDAVSMAPSE
jgi:hypothetical protein